MKKITIINPPLVSSASSYSAPALPPIGLAYVIASLQAMGHQINVIDALGDGIDEIRVDKNRTFRIRGIIDEKIVERVDPKSAFIGISCNYSVSWPITKKLINKIKKRFPDIPIVIGGEHATALGEYILESCSEADICVMGEGEKTVVELANKIDDNLSEIPGIVYRQDGKILRNTRRERISDINTISKPAWDLLPIEKYLDAGFTQGINIGRTIPIVATRGCPHECTFCSNKNMWQNIYLTRDPEQIVDEILEYKNRYQIEHIDFCDLSPTVDRGWLNRLIDEMESRDVKIKWSFATGTRSEILDGAILKRLYESGLRYLAFAPESGSKKLLEKINKRVDLKKIYRSMKNAKKHGLTVKSHFIFGLPMERRRDIIKTIIYQIRLAVAGIDDGPIFMFDPYPGSDLFYKLQKDGLIKNLDDKFFADLGCQLDLTMGGNYSKLKQRELILYRLIGMAFFYIVGYMTHPKRIFRSINNIFFKKKSETVFEQRMIESFILKQNLKDLKSSSE